MNQYLERLENVMSSSLTPDGIKHGPTIGQTENESVSKGSNDASDEHWRSLLSETSLDSWPETQAYEAGEWLREFSSALIAQRMIEDGIESMFYEGEALRKF